jgi:hypothetical protein
MGVIMMLDRAGSESDEATTPAFREWVAGQTYEDELEFAHCPDAKIHGFRVVYYPYQVRPFFPPSLPPSLLPPSLPVEATLPCFIPDPSFFPSLPPSLPPFPRYRARAPLRRMILPPSPSRTWRL